MKNEIMVNGKTYVLKERTYKIGDRFRGKEGSRWAGDIYMIIEYGTDKVNLVKLERPSGKGVVVGETCSWDGFTVKNKHNITRKELEEWGDWDRRFFDYFELIED